MTAVSLATPLPLRCGAVLDNRIAKAAMSERLADPDGAPSEPLSQLYRRWADGGAGLLVTGNVMVDRAALGEPGNVVVEDARHREALSAWARAATARGAHAWVQINHPGRQSPRTLSRQPVAPSAVPMEGSAGAFARPRALGEAEIRGIVDRFATAAETLKGAGFTGVQVHGAHGYLVNQFLSPRTNKRTDGWGGSPDGRRRFLLEVVRAVRQAVGPAFPVSVKLNSADFQRGGFDEAESMAVVEALDAEGIDLLEISGGTYESAVMFEETLPRADSSRRREAFFLEYAEKVRERTRVPRLVTGGFRTADGMRDALASGAADMIGLARPLAVEPDLPARLLSGAAQAATPVRLTTGIARLDALVQAAFYQVQLRRMAEGREPDVDLSRWCAVVDYLKKRPALPRAA